MPSKYKIALLITPALILLDQVSKSLIRDVMVPGRPITVIAGFLEFRYAENPGIAFSMMQDVPAAWRIPLFSSIALIAMVIILNLLRIAPPQSSRLAVALALIMSGALGNLMDRLRWGAVVDFIRFPIQLPVANFSWPTFNLADTFIITGILLLLWDTLVAKEGGVQAPEGPGEVPEPADKPDDQERPELPDRATFPP